MRDPPLILVVDDVPDNVDILQMRLESQGYEVVTAGDGVEALEKTRELLPDLVLLDIMMPKMDGIETVKRLKADASLPFIPVILVTAKADGADVVAGLESGGDDYLTKPVDHAALSARVRAMLRIKALHDTVQAQAQRLEEQAARARRLEQDARGTGRGANRRNRADRPTEAVSRAADRGDDRLFRRRGDPRKPPARHRRPVLRHARVYGAGRNGRAGRRDGGSERISLRARTADPSLRGNDRQLYRRRPDRDLQRPDPCPDPALRAVRLAVEMREAVASLARSWTARGHEIGFGVGIAQGYATLGRIGFEGRFDYTAIGTVTNVAARLCAEAKDGQILITQRVAAAVDHVAQLEQLGVIALRGLSRPVAVLNVSGLAASQ